MTDADEADDVAEAELERWRAHRGLPPGVLGRCPRTWALMGADERRDFIEHHGPPRHLSHASPTNPGGSVGGSYGGIR